MIEASKFKALRQVPTPEEQDKKLKNVGELYEKQFLREMVKQMRSTVNESGFVKVSQGERIFREQLDSEYVDQWGAKGGIGLADLIHKQLIEKYGAQLGITKSVVKPMGPITLDARSNFQGRLVAPSPKKWTMEFSKDLEAPTQGMTAVKMPWEGKLMKSTKLGADEVLMEALHPNGLKSQLVFRGQAAQSLVGQDLQAGEGIGLLSPEARSFYWSVEPVSKSVSE